MLPFKPLDLAANRIRWAAAIVPVWDWSDCPTRAEMNIATMVDRPGLHPAHVLDCDDGVRLIVSTERFNFGTFLHVSATPHPGTPIAAQVLDNRLSFHGFVRLVRRRVQDLGGPAGIELAHVTSRAVPHFYDPPLPADLELRKD